MEGDCHVQKPRHDHESGGGGGSGSSSNGALIKVRVSCGSSNHDFRVDPHSTFGDLKRALAKETGLDPKDQRLFLRGKEKLNDAESLQSAGVRHLSKLLLLEEPASKEKKLEEAKQMEDISRACSAIAQVRAEVDKLSEKVAALEGAVYGGTKVAEKEFVLLTEFLMRELLKLDGIEALGEAKVQRKMEVRRIQSLVETLDALKASNSKPFNNRGRGNGNG